VLRTPARARREPAEGAGRGLTDAWHSFPSFRPEDKSGGGIAGRRAVETAPTTGNQILIIEDDPPTREALEALLSLHGYSAIVAANGADGLSKLRSGLRPCLILLDLMMPEKNGFQFRVEQVIDPSLADIPVVVYSGDSEARAEGAVLGSVACLAKPIDVNQLLRLLQRYCP